MKTHMHLGECIDITSWFKILFIENNGMAYGMSFIPKIFLTLFRLVASGAIGYYIYKVVQRKHSFVYVVCLSMILAGAIGNVFDCLFYGPLFSWSSPLEMAEVVPFGQGYAPILQGRVVDMFYFPLFQWPEWMPIVGGNVFFSPVFNFADSCITVGVVALIIFCRKSMENISEEFFGDDDADEKAEESVASDDTGNNN